MLTDRLKIRLLWVGTVASMFVNIVCAHAFAVAMTVATAGHYTDEIKIFVAGVLTTAVCASLVGFYVCSYWLFQAYARKEREDAKRLRDAHLLG